MSTHRLFAALGDPTRLEMLNRLASRGPSTATELAAALPISRQAVSKHLTSLEEAGLIDRHKSGREVFYEFRPGRLGDVVQWVESVGDQWDDRLSRLRDQLE